MTPWVELEKDIRIPRGLLGDRKSLFRFQSFVNIVKEWWKLKRALALKNFPPSALTRHLGISSETIPLFEKNLRSAKMACLRFTDVRIHITLLRSSV
jgi:hypothetical protein